ncbi:MAG: SDR family NAD(P)-dependent oxidoreductase [Gammaproteobacteria bacterium]|nr:SDR family NAD(P)-dependent oxidoreductase [Gammaproteobacteria bacterium]
MFLSLADNYRAVLFGSSGGIGSALLEKLAEDQRCSKVYAGSRTGKAARGARVVPFRFDLQDEGSIVEAAAMLDENGPGDLVIVSTGLLHDEAVSPEKSLRQIDQDVLRRVFDINTIGPALIAKHFLPRLSRPGKSVFAVLSARVGSVSDNRLGGWHAYRSSKAALHMPVRNFAIELGRTHPNAVCVGLHPGTVDTPLSKPFQRSLGPDRLFAPSDTADRLIAVLDGLNPGQSGRIFAWDGEEISP